MLKYSVKQSPVGVATRMPHNQHLEWGCHQEVKHLMVILCFQILHRLDVLQQLIVLLVKNVLIVLVKFITIAKDDVLWMLQVAMNIVEFKVEVAIHLSGCCVIEAK